MERDEVLKTLKSLKNRYKNEGFLILGIFGSVARGEESNDIDIIYKIERNFIDNYKGVESINRIENIKNELTTIFHKDIDLVTINTHNTILTKTFEEEAIYV
jgi:predicted nucleotidyltransferase